MEKELQWLLREKYHGKLTKAAKKDIEILKKGETLDYVIGFTEFLGCKIDLSKRPLIPRPETEYWVGQIIANIKQGGIFGNLKMLDIFAGSGCIGVASLKHIKNIKVVFAEKEKDFIRQIKINCKLNNIRSQNYKIIQSDIFNNIQGTFDYIFANPPYVAKSRAGKIQTSVLKYEPKAALFGGSDGLWYIRKFLAEAKNFLNPGDNIFMEFDAIQKKSIETLLKKLGYKNFAFHKDQYEKWRWVDCVGTMQ